jgi:hypothetical protein
MADDTIDYKAVIAVLEKRRDALNTAIAELRSQAGLSQDAGVGADTEASGQSSTTEEPSETVVRTDSFYNLSVTQATRKYLQMVKRPRGTKDISNALQRGGFLSTSANFYSTVYTALKRDSNFVIVKRGLWGLAEWYPGRIKPKPTKTNEDQSEEAQERKPKRKARKR